MKFTTRSVTADVAKSAIDILLSRTHPLRDLDALAETCRYRRGQRIGGEARGSEYWWRIATGTALRCKPHWDGSRRVLDILGPGDFFGFSVPDECGFMIEAASDATVVRYPRWCVEFLAEVEPDTAGALRNLVRQAVSRMRRHLVRVGAMTAAAKVSDFLLDIEDRSPAESSHGFDLPASIPDIANYLALSAEAVERRMTLLTMRGAIDCEAAGRIRILDRLALAETRNERTPEWVQQSETVGVN